VAEVTLKNAPPHTLVGTHKVIATTNWLRLTLDYQ
jgi:hypothetical protein